MSADPHRVTVQHLQALAAADKMRSGATCLVDTVDGVRFVSPAAVLASGGGVRRLLMTRVDLVESAEARGLTVAAYLREYGAELARELNELNDE